MNGVTPSLNFNSNKTNTMNNQQIFQDVRTVVCKILKVPAERVTPDARLVEDLDVDSLFITQLTLELEDVFEIEISDTDTAGLTTIQSVVDFVSAHQGVS